MIYDIAVLGCGGIGSAALYYAAASGASVVGIEQFSPAHDRGSSHGHTRIIRQAYFEHPNYVPLLREAYDLWADIEQRSGNSLYVETGLIQSGPPDGTIVPGVLRSASLHNLPIEHLSASEAQQRFPMFRIPSEHVVAFEHRAGYLLVERCVETYLKLAQQNGASLLTDSRVVHWEPLSDSLVLTTTKGKVQARQILLCAGAWMPNWLSHDYAELRVLRKHLHWFRSSDSRTSREAGCPLFFFEDKAGYFYGFPAIDPRGIKVAEHSGGELIDQPESLDRSLDTLDLERIQAFLAQTFHGPLEHSDHTTCMYTMTADHHFIIDRHPDDERIWIAGGFSGHGFKFASVIGRLLFQSSQRGELDPRLDFLTLDRHGKHQD